MRKRTVYFTAILLLFISGASYGSELSSIDPSAQAGLHPIVRNSPAIDFFEGAVLGNGGLGAVVCTRPDAVVIYLGHNDVWDIRLAENHKEKIGTFDELYKKIIAIPDTLDSLIDVQWFREYMDLMDDNYRKPYPRPFPCGSVVLWFDRRNAELLGHRVNIDTGVCEIDFLIDGSIHKMEIFTDMADDIVWARMTDEHGKQSPAPFEYATLIPDPATPPELPLCETTASGENGKASFRQILPFSELERRGDYRPHSSDKAFTTTMAASSNRTDAELKTERENVGLGIIPAEKTTGTLKLMLDRSSDFIFSVKIENGAAAETTLESATSLNVSAMSYRKALNASGDIWKDYWSRSGLAIDDPLLERTWYHNLYFLRCSLRQGVTCPGLFANWSYKDIGTAWHGDYHMNYNTQQPFWAAFSSNHLELHMPYVDMVEHIILPVSKLWAKEYYGMRGAFFPHSAYPVEMSIMPYPVPTWGWEVFETPWSVQSLWWHYTYSGDVDFLRDRGFGVIREAVLFLVDYMKRPEARQGKWDDGLYHIVPSVPPELYGLRPGFDKNFDTQADLTLTRFVFKAYLEACEILGLKSKERTLINDVRDILGKFPAYPTAESHRGTVFVSVEGEDPETVYNVPASLMTVFPGEHHGLHSSKEDYELALTTFRNQQNEGGNDLVFLNLQTARLGVLDIEKFKRQIEYSLLPNGTCTDKVLQIHGRYTNNTPFDFMAPMGIWFENFALPVVVNECLMQSYNGEIRLFPNWPSDKDAEFRTLRAKGAFLVSAKLSGGEVRWIEIESEKGGALKVHSPWDTGARVECDSGTINYEGELITRKTAPGERLRIVPIK